MMNKATDYMTCKKVKSLSASKLEWFLHYGIPVGKSITIQHLMSIILYCDFTDYSTEFSATFRRLESYETLQSVKHRNREFWWQSKLFKETVQYYGKKGYDENNNPKGEKGPYFSGVNCVLPIPQFHIRLYCPTSTSKQIDVSINFAKQNGMIIQLNTESNTFSAHLPIFNCSWISRFPDEDERAFVGGMCPIRLETVRMMGNHRNYRKLFDALYLFDFILSGSIGQLNVMKKVDFGMIDELLYNQGIVTLKQLRRETKTFNDLLNCGFNDKDALDAIDKSNNDESKYEDISFDPYITSVFKAYTTQKRHIVINMAAMYHVAQHKSADVHSMIIQDSWLQPYETATVKSVYLKYKVNLLSSEIFKMVPNAKTIVIETGYCNKECFAFNLDYFLENISSSSKWNKIRIQNKSHYNISELRSVSTSWISFLWKSEATYLMKEYHKKDLLIQFDANVKKFDEEIEILEYFVITRQYNQK